MTSKVLVISGASRGIGKATAIHFRDRGYKVVNLSRSKPHIEGITHLSVDLTESESVAGVKKKLLTYIDAAEQVTVIHNAGLLLKDSSDAMEVAPFERALRVNVVMPAVLNAQLIPNMKPGSSILYVGSTLAEKGVANTCSYVVSKHAQLGLMRTTCQDLSGSGIHTACICPGFTATEMLSDHVGGSQEVLDALAAGNALERLIEPVEIAETLYFAAQSPVLNGAVIHANLGQLES